MIAALQMYDWPEVSARTDAFWRDTAAALRAVGIEAPATLLRSADEQDAWRDPALLLGQTCGLPYVSGRCGGALLVARPVYDAEGCGEGTYRSALVCRTDGEAPLEAFRGRRAAINELGSQSGCNALADAVRPLARADFFAQIVLSGSHRASARMVARGEADIAALDCVAWALLAETEPEVRRALSVMEWTPETPTLPFITAVCNSGNVMPLRRALASASGPGRGTGIPAAVLPAENADYGPIRTMAARVRGMRLAPGAPPLPHAAGPAA